MLDATDAQIVPRHIMAMPPAAAWPGRPDATLLGDAAHLMPPAGEGANHAMLDGAELALAIAAARSEPYKPPQTAPLAGALRRYEAAMFPRTSAAADSSLQLEQLGLATDAAENVERMFAGTLGG